MVISDRGCLWIATVFLVAISGANDEMMRPSMIYSFFGRVSLPRSGFLWILAVLLFGHSVSGGQVQKVWRWEPDAVLNQQRYGARGMWRDELWGFDYLNKSVWSFDGTQFKDAGKVPAGCSPLIATFTENGIYAVAPCVVNGTPMASILYSPDGYQDFEVSLQVNSSTDGVPFALGQDHSLVDLGEGQMLYFQYSDEARIMHTADAGRTWQLLIQPENKSIRHWHGAYYDKEYGKLYAFAGDNNTQSTITVVDDLFGENGLIQNPDLWKQRWGLTDKARTTRDEAYFVKPDGVTFSQRTRTVDMEIDGDYIYWGEDRASGNGISLYRVHRQTMEVNEPGQGDIIGSPWRFLHLQDGTMLFATNSVWYQGSVVAGSDKFARIYVMNDERTDYSEVVRFPISRRVQTGADPLGFTEAFNRVWLNGYLITEVNADLVGRVVEMGIGDFDNDDQYTVDDIDILAAALRNGEGNPADYDLNNDGLISAADHKTLVEDLIRTYYGDSNLDSQFDSKDLIQVLAAGEYLDNYDGNSTWATGDWNGDGDFDPSDLTLCFQSGGYERGPRAVAAVPVPEPASIALVCSAASSSPHAVVPSGRDEPESVVPIGSFFLPGRN